MKVTLTNFKHWRNATFEIPDKGLVLVSGWIGTGKSTILNAISYALYGNIRKPLSHGVKTCKVVLEIKNAIITRTNRPNRLLLVYKETEYEDDGAQGVIHQLFGMTCKEFMTSSYIVQRLTNSVISMTPTEQAKFVETLAFSDDVHKECRAKFKTKVKDCKVSLTHYEGQYTALDRQLCVQKEALPELPPNLDGISRKDVKSEQSQLRLKLNSYKKDLSTLGNELKELQVNESRNIDLQETKRTLEIEMSQYISMRSQLGEVETPEKIEKLELEVEGVKCLLNKTVSYLAHKITLGKAEKFRDEHLDVIRQKIADIQKILPSTGIEDLYIKVSGLERIRRIYDSERQIIQAEKLGKSRAITSVKRIFIEVKRIYSIKSLNITKGKVLLKFLCQKTADTQCELESVEKVIAGIAESITRQKIYGNIYKCPDCHSVLQFRGEQLHKVKDSESEEPQRDYEMCLNNEKMTALSARTQLNKLREWIGELEDSLKIIATLETPRTVEYDHADAVESTRLADKYNLLEEKLSNLQNQVKRGALPPSITALFEEAKLQNAQYSKDFTPDLDVNTIEKNVSNLTSNLTEIWRVRSEHSSLTREIVTREGKIACIVKMLGGKKFLPSKKTRGLKIVGEEIRLAQIESVECSARLTDLQETFELISNYEIYQKELLAIENLDAELAKTAQTIKETERKLQGAIGLEEAGKEAEIMAMRATIDSINEHAKGYLERMFEDPITVRLQGHKTTSRGEHRTQMNTVVIYRGEESSIDDLSGGEEQLCELAFLLAVNDMIGSDIILLDECINNLDSDVNTKILNNLKDVGKDKLVLVCSHEAVRGIFDKIIEL